MCSTAKAYIWRKSETIVKLKIKRKMIETIIYLAGVILAIWCVIDILKKPIGLVGKIVMAIVVLATSWIGSLLYYFWARHHVTSWFK